MFRRVDLRQHPRSQIMSFQKMAELAHRRLVRHRLAAQIDLRKSPPHRRVVQSFLHRRVRQVEPLLQKIDAQHALQTHRVASVASRRIVRRDQAA